MRLTALIVVFFGMQFAQARAAAAEAEPVQHEFVIQNFKTESGTVLPEARIVYGTYGKLNAKGDNAILLPSHYMAEMHGYGWLIGPGKALDPNKLFLVTSELFGNGRSSSPSNTPEPFHGPRFPVTTIRDNVAAVHRMLTEQLHVQHLRAVIGFSMGAQQAFQWAVSYPGYLDGIVATSGTAKTYGHGIVRLEGQIAALTADAAFEGGASVTDVSFVAEIAEIRPGTPGDGSESSSKLAAASAARLQDKRRHKPILYLLHLIISVPP